ALEEITERLQRQDVFCRPIKVDVASHSPQMDALRAELVQVLDGLKPRRSATPIYSTVTGTVTDGHELDARYWVRNLREPVLFSVAVQRLLEGTHELFLEVSPHPILLSAIQQGLDHSGREGVVLPSLRRGEVRTVLLGSLGVLYALGHSVDWPRLYPDGGQCVRLPSYPWQRERCWLETGEPGTAVQPAGGGAAQHPPRGRHLKSAHPPGSHFWQIDLDRQLLPAVEDHRVQGARVLSASTYVDMALAAAAETLGAGPWMLEEIEFHRALFVPESGARTIQVVVAPCAEGGASFHLYSCAGAGGRATESWTLHARGKIGDDPDPRAPDDPEQAAPDEIRTRCPEVMSREEYYRRLAEQGIQYGPGFQHIERLWRGEGEALGKVRLPETLEPEADAHQLHPAILETCFQLLGAALPVEAKDVGSGDVFLPIHVARVRGAGLPGLGLWGHARFREAADPGAGSLEGSVRLLDETGRVVVELLGVRFRRLGPAAQGGGSGEVEEWLCELEWQASAPSEGRQGVAPSGGASGGSWLIFADSGGIGEALAGVLGTQGEQCVLVWPGDGYERLDGGHVRIHPARRDHVRQLLKALGTPDSPACRGVVHLWSLDATPPEETTIASLEAAQTLGCHSVLTLVQELIQVGWSQPPSLWLVTRGAQPVGTAPVPLAVSQAPLWGFGRVVAEEHPALWGGLIDLDPRAPPPQAAAMLGAEVRNPDRERQLAFRNGQRYAARLVRRRTSAPPLPPLPWRANGTYLITGGLGDLGLEVARWMAAQGARRLILLGRSQLPPRSRWNEVQDGTRLARQVSLIRELEALGASVHLAAVDVADEAGLASFLEAFRGDGWPPIRGVWHLAGVLEDRLLEQLDVPALDAVLRPKVVGGWLLHRLLDDAALDFFVLFSSAGSLLGQPGQANYAAANAFLDALAHHRRAQRRPALSINWGAWAELGFAATPGGRRLARHAAVQGIAGIPPRQGLELLERLLAQGATQAAVLPVNWPRYRRVHGAGSEPLLLSELAREQTDVAPGAGGPRPKGSLSRDALIAAEPGERQRVLESYLRDLVARALGLPASDLDMRQPLNTLGLDSLMAVQVKNRVETDLGVIVPVVSFLAGRSAAELAGQVLEQLTAPVPPSPAARLENAEELLANIDRLPDDTVDALLSALLDEEEEDTR
ncbi:MAG: polyketide synthase dehydratase domain-containing protein, partial [Candidatus Rokubacteria bacterium]|nr:polyketide synthase dehydratase domain-containing protein [Candidatus Rokubacteria bacterium]